MRPRALGLIAAAATAAALATPAHAAEPSDGCAYSGASPHTVSVAQTRTSTLCLLNIERRRRELRPLASDERLELAAVRHARDMDGRNYFSHDSPGGATFVDRIRRARYLRHAETWVVGENLAWGTNEVGSPRSIVRAWMNSPGHRANILQRRFREIGIGVALGAPAEGKTGGTTYATSFGAVRR